MNAITTIEHIPQNKDEALSWLFPLLDKSEKELRLFTHQDFVRGWASILFLYPGLHPDGACEKGEETDCLEEYYIIESLPEDFLKSFFKVSGWPVALVPVASEAWRRYDNNQLSEDELYFAEAQMAGLKYIRK